MAKHHAKTNLAFAMSSLLRPAIPQPTRPMDVRSVIIKPLTREIDCAIGSLPAQSTQPDSLICTLHLPKSILRVLQSFQTMTEIPLDTRNSQNFSHHLSRLGLPLEGSNSVIRAPRGTHGKTSETVRYTFLQFSGVIFVRLKAIEPPLSPR